MVRGAWLMAQGGTRAAERGVVVGAGGGGRPRGLLEPWAMSQQSLIIDQFMNSSIMFYRYYVFPNSQIPKFQSFWIPKFWTFEFPQLQTFKVPRCHFSNFRSFKVSRISKSSFVHSCERSKFQSLEIVAFPKFKLCNCKNLGTHMFRATHNLYSQMY